jgi:hypothetical protein
MEINVTNIVPLNMDDEKFLQVKGIWRVFIKNVVSKKLNSRDFTEISNMRPLIHKITDYNKLYELVKERNDNNTVTLFNSVLCTLKYATDDLLAYVLVVFNIKSSDLIID